MSRVGKLPINIPEDVEIDLNGLNVSVSGPLGKISKSFRGDIAISILDNKLIVKPLFEPKCVNAMWGTVRSIINWMIIGVKTPFVKNIEMIGVGYKASVNGKYLVLSLGKSHDTRVLIPDSINVKIQSQISILLSSYDKELLGSTVALILNQRKVEPYKGKGLILKGQYIPRKEGKKS